jgi:hypothetical protein
LEDHQVWLDAILEGPQAVAAMLPPVVGQNDQGLLRALRYR